MEICQTALVNLDRSITQPDSSVPEENIPMFHGSVAAESEDRTVGVMDSV